MKLAFTTYGLYIRIWHSKRYWPVATTTQYGLRGLGAIAGRHPIPCWTLRRELQDYTKRVASTSTNKA